MLILAWASLSKLQLQDVQLILGFLILMIAFFPSQSGTRSLDQGKIRTKVFHKTHRQAVVSERVPEFRQSKSPAMERLQEEAEIPGTIQADKGCRSFCRSEQHG